MSNGPASVGEYRREGVRVNLQIVTTGAVLLVDGARKLLMVPS
jgi:hypothetical protein